MTPVGPRLPAQLRTYVPERWGAPGRAWLAGLPSRIAELAARWRLSEVVAAEDANRSMVARATRDGVRVWLKIEFDPAWRSAADTVAAWSAREVTPAVLARDDGHRATLLADAGSTPSPPDPLALSRAVGRLLARVRDLAPPASVGPRDDVDAPWRDLDRRRAQQLAETGVDLPFDTGLLDLTLPQGGPPVWLHGDLFPANVRCLEGRTRLIDPAPWRGPVEHDLVHWALRIEAGRRWVQHLEAVSQGVFDPRLAAALAARTARTFLLYQLATGRVVSPHHVRLARVATADADLVRATGAEGVADPPPHLTGPDRRGG